MKKLFYTNIRYTIRKNVDVVKFELISTYTGIIYKEFYFLKYNLFNKKIYKITDLNFNKVFKIISDKHQKILKKI